MSDVDTRLAELEREVKGCRRSARRDRLIMGGLTALVAFLAIGGMRQPEKVADELRVKSLVIVDDAGKGRVTMGVKLRMPELSMTDENGKERVALRVRADGSPMLDLRDDKGEDRLELFVDPNGSALLGMHDEKGKLRARMLLLADGMPRFVLSDANGKERAVLGAGNVVSPDGAKATYPESTLMLFGPDGKVLWKSPKAP